MDITLQLFGAFRPFGQELTLATPDGSMVSDLRKVLLEKITQIDSGFNKPGLIDSSRFATETEILPETTPLQTGMVLAIIPPVSGG